MSMLLMVKAMKTKVGNPLRKLVLIKLADNANDNGECWPSYQHIADQCEISRSTVKTHVRELEKSGMLRREYRRNGDINQSNIFHLTLDGGATVDLGGAAKDLGGAGAALGGGAADDPRTYHSLEPVKEPLPFSEKKVISLDEKEVINTWNEIAKQRNFKGCRIITDSVKKNIIKIHDFHCKEKKKNKLEPMEITEFTCQYLKYGFEKWAGQFYSGQAGYRADLEYATRKSVFEKIYSEL